MEQVLIIVDHPVWAALQQHILKSLPEYAALLGLFMVAVIANMIHPDVFRAWLMEVKPTYIKFKEGVALLYEWFYNSLQAFMAARSPKNPPPPVVVPPATSAVVTTTLSSGSASQQVVPIPSTPEPPKEG